jgi:hypothetical protein
MAVIFTLNGVTVKTPQNFSVGVQTIDADSSGRNADGRMVRDVVAEKTKLQVKWGSLSSFEMSQILRVIQAPFFKIQYFDPTEGGHLTKTFYCGDRSAPVYSWNEKYQQSMWESLSVNFIEQ